jgi:hypothetical protein
MVPVLRMIRGGKRDSSPPVASVDPEDVADAQDTTYRSASTALSSADLEEIDRFSEIASILVLAGVNVRTAWSAANEWIEEHPKGLPEWITVSPPRPATMPPPRLEHIFPRAVPATLPIEMRRCRYCGERRPFPDGFRALTSSGGRHLSQQRCGVCTANGVSRGRVNFPADPIPSGPRRCSQCWQMKKFPDDFRRPGRGPAPRKCTACFEKGHGDALDQMPVESLEQKRCIARRPRGGLCGVVVVSGKLCVLHTARLARGIEVRVFGSPTPPTTVLHPAKVAQPQMTAVMVPAIPVEPSVAIVAPEVPPPPPSVEEVAPAPAEEKRMERAVARARMVAPTLVQSVGVDPGPITMGWTKKPRLSRAESRQLEKDLLKAFLPVMGLKKKRTITIEEEPMAEPSTRERVLDLLQSGPKTLVEFKDLTGLGAGPLGGVLVRLQKEGLVSKEEGRGTAYSLWEQKTKRKTLARSAAKTTKGATTEPDWIKGLRAERAAIAAKLALMDRTIDAFTKTG